MGESFRLDSYIRTTETLDSFRNARRSPLSSRTGANLPNLNPRKETNFAQDCERFAYQRSRGMKHQLSMRQETSPAPVALPPRWDPPGPSAAGRRKVAGWRAPEAGGGSQCASSPLSYPTFPASVLLITRDGLPLFVLSLLSYFSLFASSSITQLALLLSFSFWALRLDGSPGGDVCTHLPHMAMATPILCSCFGLFTVLTCFLRLLLDRICWLRLRNSQLVLGLVVTFF